MDKLPLAIEVGAVVPEWQGVHKPRYGVDELTAFGVSNLADLAELIPPDLDTRLVDLKYPSTGLLSVCRLVMLITDAERCFDQAWRQHWSLYSKSMPAILQTYGVEIEPHLRKHGIEPA
jgi:hypothetical protein